MSIKDATLPVRYVALDALRGSAAFAVMFYHLSPRGGTTSGPSSLFASGYLAVDMFFVLSGFVIGHAYETRLRQGLSSRDFMIARFIRLQPAIAIGTLIGFALAIWQRAFRLEGAPGVFAIVTALPANLLMLPDIFVPWGIFLFNPPAWSLFYELLANAAYAIGLKLRVSNAPPSLSLNRVLGGICLLGGIALTASIGFVGSLDRGVILSDWPVAVSRIGFSFPLGLLLHRTRDHWMPNMPRIAVPLLLTACLGCLAPSPSGTARMAYDLMFATIGSPILVMLAAATGPSPRLAPFAHWLGMISYPLYAVHAPIKHLLATVLTLRGPVLLGVTIPIIIGAAWLTARIEPYLRRWLERQWQLVRLPAAAPPTSSSRT